MLFSPSEKLCVCFEHSIPYECIPSSISFHMHNHSFSWSESLVLPSSYHILTVLDHTCIWEQGSGWIYCLREVKLVSCMIKHHHPFISVLSLLLPMHTHVLIVSDMYSFQNGNFSCFGLTESYFWSIHSISVSSPFHTSKSEFISWL